MEVIIMSYVMKNKLKEILKDKKISMSKVAEDLDMRYATLRRVVSDEYLDTTQMGTLYLITSYLNISIDDSFEFDIEPVKAELGDIEGNQDIEDLYDIGFSIQQIIKQQKGYKEGDESKYFNLVNKHMKDMLKDLKNKDKDSFVKSYILLCKIAGEKVDDKVIKALSKEDWTTDMYAVLTGVIGF